MVGINQYPLKNTHSSRQECIVAETIDILQML